MYNKERGEGEEEENKVLRSNSCERCERIQIAHDYARSATTTSFLLT
jgi:hypothetical protein